MSPRKIFPQESFSHAYSDASEDVLSARTWWIDMSGTSSVEPPRRVSCSGDVTAVSTGRKTGTKGLEMGAVSVRNWVAGAEDGVVCVGGWDGVIVVCEE